MPLNEQEREAQMVKDILAGAELDSSKTNWNDIEQVEHLLGGHLLSPLFIEYERQIVALELEVRGLKDELNRKNDLERKLLD